MALVRRRLAKYAMRKGHKIKLANEREAFTVKAVINTGSVLIAFQRDNSQKWEYIAAETKVKQLID